MLRETGREVIVVDVEDDDRPPYAARYVARAALQIAAAAPRSPIGLIGHSGAGPLLPQVGFAQRAARRQVGAYVFVDAGVPRPGATRLDLIHGSGEAVASQIRRELERGALVPTWRDEELAASGLGPAERATVLAAMRPRPLAFFEEEVPFPGDWPDAPCGYLRTSAAYDAVARLAARRGFPVVSIDGGHFAALTGPGALADALLELVTRL